MNATNVEKLSDTALTFLSTRKVTLEKSLPSAVDKGASSAKTLESSSTRKVMVIKGLRSVVRVGTHYLGLSSCFV